jgi:ketosteroid isomerase-like protein
VSQATHRLDPADALEIAEVLARYGHIVDERAWSRMGEVFTEDLVFVPSDNVMQTTRSLQDLIARWSRPDFHHPAAHHSTNLVMTVESDTTVRTTCKGLAIEEDGRVWSVVYDDEFRRTQQGWRIRHRAVARRPSTVRPT